MRPLHRVALLCLVAGCALPRAPRPEAVEYYGPRSRAFLASEAAAFEAVLAALEDLDCAVDATDEPAGRVVAHTPEEGRFFALMGEQCKRERITVLLASTPAGRTRIDVNQILIHGPAGGDLREGGAVENTEWLEDFYDRVRARLAALTTSP